MTLTAYIHRSSFFCNTILLVSIVFCRLIGLGFNTADDDWMLLGNPLVPNLEFSRSYFATLLTSFHDIQYSPVNTLYYALIYRINGFDPYYFHFFSLLIHIVNGYLIYRLSLRLISIFGISYLNNSIAYIVALIWLIAPINVEAVAWISASKVLLYSFFTLLTFLSYMSALEKHRWQYYGLSVVFYVLSLLCKEQAVVTATMMLLYFLMTKGKSKPYYHIVGWHGVFFILLFCIGLFFSIVTLKANGTAPDFFYQYPFYQRFFFSFYCLFFYVFNSLLPIDLHYHYTFPMGPQEPLPAVYYAFPILFFLIIYFIRRYQGLKSNTLLKFCVLAFFINLFLCLQIVPLNRPAIMADRYMYLPLVFLLIPVVAFVFKWIPGLPVFQKTIVLGISSILMVYYIICSNMMVAQWNVNIIH